MGADASLEQRERLRRLVADIDWARWERTIEGNGVTLDRPRGCAHPAHPEIIYPIDYGYVNGTLSDDGEEVDVFVGTGSGGLVAAIATFDRRKNDVELKLLWNCRPEEIYLVNGFINFDRRLMEGTLAMRRPLRELWDAERGPER